MRISSCAGTLQNSHKRAEFQCFVERTRCYTAALCPGAMDCSVKYPLLKDTHSLQFLPAFRVTWRKKLIYHDISWSWESQEKPHNYRVWSEQELGPTAHVFFCEQDPCVATIRSSRQPLSPVCLWAVKQPAQPKVRLDHENIQVFCCSFRDLSHTKQKDFPKALLACTTSLLEASPHLGRTGWVWCNQLERASGNLHMVNQSFLKFIPV